MAQASLAWNALSWLTTIQRYKVAAEGSKTPEEFAAAKSAAADYYNKLRSNGLGAIADRTSAMNAAQLLSYVNSAALDEIKAALGIPPDDFVAGPSQPPSNYPTPDQATPGSEWGSPVSVPAGAGQLLSALAQAVAAPGAWLSAQVNAVGPFVRYLVPALLGLAAIKAFGKSVRLSAMLGGRR